MSVHTGIAGRRTVGRVWASGALAALASVVIAASALATDFGPTRVLRTAASGVPINAQDIAARRSNIGVAWTEGHVGHRRSFLRWSTNAGDTFGPKLGLPEFFNVAVDICAGFVWTVADVAAPSGYMHLDGWSLTGSTHRQLSFPLGTHDGDIACVGDRALAATWDKDVIGGQRITLRLWTISSGGHLAQANTWDLGATDTVGELSLAATNSTVDVAWMKARDLRFKRIELPPGPDPVATPQPTTTVTTFVTDQAGRPVLAADGHAVALAYYYLGDARVRVSYDFGDSFGSYSVVFHNPPHSEGVANPLSIDVLGGPILVEVEHGCCTTVESKGFVSRDSGTSWHATSSHENGAQLGAIYGSEDVQHIAEVWDMSGPAHTDHQTLRFHTGNIPGRGC